MHNSTKIIHTGKTVFSIQDLKNILQIPTIAGLNSFLRRAKKDGILQSICNGIRALQTYDVFELACKLKKRSYISLETVLVAAGIVFQNYDGIITCVSDNTKVIHMQHKTFRYSKIKNDILYNTLGISIKKTTMIASPERAMCDLVYLRPAVDVENIQLLNVEKLLHIASIYPATVLLHISKLLQYAR